MSLAVATNSCLSDCMPGVALTARNSRSVSFIISRIDMEPTLVVFIVVVVVFAPKLVNELNQAILRRSCSQSSLVGHPEQVVRSALGEGVLAVDVLRDPLPEARGVFNDTNLTDKVVCWCCVVCSSSEPGPRRAAWRRQNDP